MQGARAAARALPRLFEELVRAALDTTDASRRREVIEHLVLGDNGRIVRSIVSAGASSDWLISVLRKEGACEGSPFPFPFGVRHYAVAGCRVAPDSRNVELKELESVPALQKTAASDRAWEMRGSGWREACLSILDSLKAMDVDQKFAEPSPVTSGKNPMDLGTLRAQFSNYPDAEAFAKDVKLVFTNALAYCDRAPNSDKIRETAALARKMQSRFDRENAAFLSRRVPDCVKATLARVATRARFAALDERVGAGGRAQLDRLGRTGLSLAITLGRADIIRACCYDSQEADTADALGLLPQHYAAMRGDVSTLDVVLGAATKGVDFPTAAGQTALHLAAVSAPQASRLMCCANLLRRGASPWRRAASGLNALDLLVYAPVAQWTSGTRAAAAANAAETIALVLAEVQPRSAPPPLPLRARRPSAYDPPPSEDESRQGTDEFLRATGVDGEAAEKLRALGPEERARLVRRLEISAAAGTGATDLAEMILAAGEERYAATASELDHFLDPVLRPVADRLALTSAAVWRLATLEPTEQKDLAYRFAEPGLLDDKKDLDQFVAQAFETEKPYESLVAELILALEPHLVNAIQGLAVDLSRSCVKELRALDASTQRKMAAALPTLDFRGVRDPSAYVRSLLRRATAGVEEIKDEPVAPVVSLSAWNAVVEAVTAVPCLAVAGEAEAILQGSLPVKAPLAVDLALALEFDGTDVEPLHVARDADTVRALVARGPT